MLLIIIMIIIRLKYEEEWEEEGKAQKTEKQLLKLDTFFFGPCQAKFIAFFLVFFSSLLRSRCLPSLGASFGGF